MDIRDRPEPQTTYVAEDNILLVDDDIEVSGVFTSFDLKLCLNGTFKQHYSGCYTTLGEKFYS